MIWAAVALAVLATVTPTRVSDNTIEVAARVQHSNVAKLPPTGRAGDATSSRWIIRDRHGKTIGDMLTDCRWVTSGLRLCIGQVSLPLGALAVLGTSRTPFLGQFAVVGGTGQYAGANGAMTFNAIGTGRYVLSITYRKETA